MEFVPVKGEVRPSGDFPVLRDRFIRLGFRPASSTTERNQIKRQFRTFPMWVIVGSVGESAVLYSLKAEPGTLYTVDNDWDSIPLGIDFDNGLNFIDNYDASSNTPDLVANQASYKIGDYFIVNVGGTQDFGNGNEVLDPLDWVILTTTGWKGINIAGAITWDTLQNRPASLINYVNGIVIAHQHNWSDITDAPTLSSLITSSRVAVAIPSTGSDTQLPTVKAVRDYFANNYQNVDLTGYVQAVLRSTIPLSGQDNDVATIAAIRDYVAANGASGNIATGINFTGNLLLNNREGTIYNSYTQSQALVLTIDANAINLGYDILPFTSNGNNITIPAGFDQVSGFTTWNSGTRIATLAAGDYRIFAKKIGDKGAIGVVPVGDSQVVPGIFDNTYDNTFN